MDSFSEAEIQALIAVLEVTRADKAANLENLADVTTFHKYRVDRTDAPANLVAQGLLMQFETFPRETLPPDKTPLGEALAANGLRFETWDFTQDDYGHARLKKQVLEELRLAFEAEGNMFLYDNRHGEAEGVMREIEAELHARYLYHVMDSSGSDRAGDRNHPSGSPVAS